MRKHEELVRYVKNLARKLCPGWFQESWIEDVEQEALCKIAGGDDKAGGLRELKSGYVFDMVRNARTKIARQVNRRLGDHFPDEVDDNPIDSVDHNSADPLRAVIIGDAIRSCSLMLRQSYRRALLMRLAGYGLEEIAFHLNCTVRAAENKVRRARQRMRRYLKRRGVEP